MRDRLRRFRLIAAIALAALAAQPAAGRVVLVGLDGASWNVIDRLIDAGELPHFAALARRGVTADLTTVEPVISPVVWTSVATGRRPESHGVTSFLPTRLGIEVPSVFERLAVSGARVGLYEYLVTWPPQPLPNGFVIPGWMRRDESTTPADVWRRAQVEPFRLRDQPSRAAYFDEALEEASSKASRWNALAAAFDLDVGAVTFYGIDRVGHRFWHAQYPEAFASEVPPVDPAHRDAVHDVVRATDAALGVIAEALGPDDVIVIASDHGFRAADEMSDRWISKFAERLPAAVLDPRRDHFSVESQFAAVMLRVHPGPFEERDATLEKLRARLVGITDVEGEPIYLTLVIDGVERPPEARRPLLERIQQWGAAYLMSAVYDFDFDRPAHAFVIGYPDAERLERLWPGGELVESGERVPIVELFDRDTFSGTHLETGVFLASGGPVRATAERGRVSVLEIAPLLFHLAGRAIPDDLEAELPSRLLEPAHLEAQPPRIAPAAEYPALGEAGGPGSTPEGEALLRERLRSLGYLD